LRARLTVDFVEQQFNLYRSTRQRVKEQLALVQQAGYQSIRLVGEGDVADVCKLTCMEQGIELSEDEGAPVLEVAGFKVILHMEAEYER
jgi:fructose-1,6-bisphosphatase/sedoheptulose 1,7-bisphosphatase-like protein